MKKCNQCHRAGPSLSTCGSFATCPGRTSTGTRFIDPESPMFTEVDASKDVAIECPKCKATAAVSVHDIARGRAQVEFRCQLSEAHCEARIAEYGDHEVPIEETQVVIHKARKPKA